MPNCRCKDIACPSLRARPKTIWPGLTYYFNPRQQVQRITFHGTTGNSQRLIQLVVTQYRFGRHLVNDARVFRYEVAEAAGPAKSYLEIRPMQVVKSVDPYRRLEVVLVMERPEG